MNIISSKTIGVFCSADDKIHEEFKAITLKLGLEIVKNNYARGSKTGLMNEDAGE
jgi:hypothetical protein